VRQWPSSGSWPAIRASCGASCRRPRPSRRTPPAETPWKRPAAARPWGPLRPSRGTAEPCSNPGIVRTPSPTPGSADGPPPAPHSRALRAQQCLVDIRGAADPVLKVELQSSGGSEFDVSEGEPTWPYGPREAGEHGKRAAPERRPRGPGLRTLRWSRSSLDPLRDRPLNARTLRLPLKLSVTGREGPVG
jgi:hypothetical protein